MTARPPVRAESDRGVDTLVLDVPETRNALSLALLEELLARVGTSAERDARALVLRHEGPVFCAGVDLRERRALPPGDGRHSALLARLFERLWSFPAPVLCVVEGPVRGGGLGLVACGDIVIASPAANFAFSEVRVGVAPALVAAVAGAKVPSGALVPWLVTGEPFDAGVAAALGLVTRVADDPGAALARDLAAILRGGPNAVRTVKRLARGMTGDDVPARIREMEALSAELFAGDEAREGLAAFAERRPPSWAISAR